MQVGFFFLSPISSHQQNSVFYGELSRSKEGKHIQLVENIISEIKHWPPFLLTSFFFKKKKMCVGSRKNATTLFRPLFSLCFLRSRGACLGSSVGGKSNASWPGCVAVNGEEKQSTGQVGGTSRWVMFGRKRQIAQRNSTNAALWRDLVIDSVLH